MTDPDKRNEPDATIARDEPDVDATVGPDDDDATVIPDEDPAYAAKTVTPEVASGNDDAPGNDDVTMHRDDEDDDDATVIPDDDQTVNTDMGPATVVEEPIDGDQTLVREEEEDDDLTVYGDDAEDDDQTVMRDEDDDDQTVMSDEEDNDQTVMSDDDESAAATRIDVSSPGETLGRTVDSEAGSVGATSTGESLSGGKTRLSFGKSKAPKSKSGKAPKPKKSEPDKPRYDLVDNFAHGGMGNIWKAHDQRIHRDVAYKELLPRALRRPRVVERFVQEAQITGQLEHPCIVPIYDLGNQENGAPFYAMKLIHGTEMKDHIEDMHKLPKDSTEYRRTMIKLLHSLIDTCNAMGFAHQRGVLHRDLKPQNVMLGGFGETLVLDWGLAKILGGHEAAGDGGMIVSGDYDEKFDADEESPGESLGDLSQATDATKILDESSSPALAATQMTGTAVQTDSRSAGTETKYGSVMGTPAYMPPEQAEGKLDLMDGRTDIYSIGAILYEILVNDAPIPRTKMDQMLDHVINKPIKPPIEIVPSTPPALSAIAMKALSKRREDRYATALDMARDVEDYLADEPVSAYPEPFLDKALRWARRHRTAVTAAVAVVVAVAIGSIAWSSLESARIGRLQSTAEAKMTEASGLSGESKFEDAKLVLNEAMGLLGNEESLHALRTGISGQLSAIDRLVESAERDRINALTLEVEQALTQAKELAASGSDLNGARTALTEIVTRLADEPGLSDLHGRANAELNTVTDQIENQERRALAQQEFSQFLDLVDQARFYATVSTGDDLVLNTNTARDAADSAFELYGGMTKNYLSSAPPLLSEAQAEDVRSGSYELLLIKAESELTLVQNADESARQAAAARALEALAQAEALGIESRALVLRRARYYDIAGDVNQRDLTLLAAEAITPKSALDFFLIGEELRRAGQLEKALTSYRQALQIDPSQFWSLHQMALTHLLGGQAEAAVAGYTACIARRPDERICYLTRGIAYASLSQIEPALADLNKARDLDPNLYAVYLNRGAVYVAKKDLEAAIADFKHAAELRPGHAGPFVNLGETYRIQENYDESEAALTKALELDANNSKAHRIRALTRLQLMKVDEARADFEQVIALDKDPLSQADAWQQIGKTWHRGGEPDMALEAYDQSIAANPKNSDTYRLKAEVLLSLNRDQDAVDAFTKFLEFGKPVGDVYRARSLAYSKLGLFREAMNDYTRALELEPSANMLVRRGWAYLMEANKLALADFDAAVSENPDNADAWNGRGYARVMMGDYPRAIADADEALTRAAKQIEAEGPSAWPHVYNAATIYAQAVGKVLQDGRRTSEDREKRASQLTIKAIQIIGQTLKAAGPGQQAAVIQTLQTDTAINPIRNRPEFRQAFAPKPPPNNN